MVRLVPRVFSLVSTESGFLLIGTFASSVELIGRDQNSVVLTGNLVCSCSFVLKNIKRKAILALINLETGQPISVFICSFTEQGEALWANAVGIDWKDRIGPFSIQATQGLGSEIVMAGNYFKSLQLGDDSMHKYFQLPFPWLFSPLI